MSESDPIVLLTHEEGHVMAAVRSETRTPVHVVAPGPVATLSLILALSGVAAVSNASWLQQDELFADGFESGNACTWSSVLSLDPCDGADNDCDAEFDENADCDDGHDCTTDTCGGALGCQNDVDFGWCLIDGVCWEGTTPNPDDPCLSCIHILDPTGWTVADGGECPNGTCDDQGACICDEHYSDCDPLASNGCETPTDADISNCGGCDNVCDLPHTAGHYCFDGECRVGTCDEHFANCDSLHDTGCELSLGHAEAMENTCETSILITSSEFCGDEGSWVPQITNRGSRWAKIYARECSNWDQDFTVAFTLLQPAGAVYAIGDVVEVACDSSDLCPQHPVPWCNDCSWSDGWNDDDSRWLYVPVYHVSGSSCENWTLRAHEYSYCAK